MMSVVAEVKQPARHTGLMDKKGSPNKNGSNGGELSEAESGDRRAEKRIDGILTEIEDTTYGVLRKHDKKSP
jgi:hypothetical protein